MPFLPFLFVVLCLSLCLPTWANHDSLRIHQLGEEALTLMEEGDLTQAQNRLTDALQAAKQVDRLTDFFTLVKNYARFRRTQLKDPEGALADYAREKDRWREPVTQAEWDALAWLHVNHGYTLAHALGRFAEAVGPYTQASQIFSAHPAWQDKLVARYIYKALGDIHTRLGDYPAAETLLKRCLPILEKSDKPEWAVDVYSDLGILYQSWEKHAEALDALQAAGRFSGISEARRGLIQNNISLVQDAMGQQEAARVAINQAITYLENAIQNETANANTALHLANAYAQRAGLDQAEQEFASALNNLSKARQLSLAYFGSSHRREIGKLDVQKGLLLLEARRPMEALAAFQEALRNTVYRFTPTNDYDNPERASIRAENTISQALLGKAMAHETLAQDGEQIQELEMALRNYELAAFADRVLWQRYLYDDAKLLNLEAGHDRTDKAIGIALRLAHLQEGQGYEERAFQLAENSRSLLLLEAFRKAETSKTSLLNTETQTRERYLREALAQAENGRYEIEGEMPSDSLRNAAETAVLIAHQAYRNWRDSLSLSNPALRQLSFTETRRSLLDMQEMLGPDRAMISYFPTRDHLFAFYLDQQDLRIFTLEDASLLAERVTQMRLDLERFQFNGSDRSALCQSYTRLGHELYVQLLGVIEAEVELPERLLIIPGGVLHYLPFDALLTEKPNKSCDFQQYPYLLRRHEISLGYSANLQYDLYQTILGESHFAGFAPDFSSSKDWASLVCSKDRLQAIAANLGGDYFGNKRATADVFRNTAGKYGILQLGTHAQANTDDADFGFIVFASEQEGQFDSLFVNDIYNLDLQAELVALSACETAVGELYASEGVLSLGRGFLYAGARSIMSTLWRINESANCDLLDVFYDELKSGNSKSAALRKAKQDYLEQADRQYAHPVYWAAFQLVGNERPLQKRTLAIWPFALIGCMLSGGLWYRFRD